MKINLWKVVLAIFVLVMVALFYVKDPASSWYIACPFKLMTGYDCPGCGGQRALHQLLHFNFKNAFLLNPLLIMILPLIMMAAIVNFNFFKAKFPKISQSLFSNKMIVAMLVLTLFFFIFRNTEIYHCWMQYLK